MHIEENTQHDDGGVGELDPAAALAMLRGEQAAVREAIGGATPWILGAWGFSWLVGFCALWLIDGLPGVRVPLPIAVAVYVGLMVLAVVVTIVASVRSSRGIRSSKAQAFTGLVFGSTAFIGFLVIYGIGFMLAANGIDRDLLNLFFPCTFVAFVGITYLFAAAVWRIRSLAVLGLLLTVIAVVSGFFGYPTHYLILAIGGGGLLLVAAPIAMRVQRSVR